MPYSCSLNSCDLCFEVAKILQFNSCKMHLHISLQHKMKQYIFIFANPPTTKVRQFYSKVSVFRIRPLCTSKWTQFSRTICWTAQGVLWPISDTARTVFFIINHLHVIQFVCHITENKVKRSLSIIFYSLQTAMSSCRLNYKTRR